MLTLLLMLMNYILFILWHVLIVLFHNSLSLLYSIMLVVRHKWFLLLSYNVDSEFVCCFYDALIVFFYIIFVGANTWPYTDTLY